MSMKVFNCSIEGSGYSSGRLSQTVVNNQRFSAAEPIDNQVTVELIRVMLP